MRRDEAKTILAKIHLLYPLFNKDNNKEMAALWLDQLEKGDYRKTHKALMQYSLENKYTPTLADIIIKEVKRDDNRDEELERMEAAVEAERSDPEANAKREAAIREMQERIRGVLTDD